MKKTILVIGCATLAAVVALRAYFAITPVDPPSIHAGDLAGIFPDSHPGWNVRDLPMAASEEASARISDFLNFDDSLYRVYMNGATQIGVYVAYWSPGKVSYRWAGAHTPDTCWVLNGWDRNHREYSIPFSCAGINLKPVEYGIYSREGTAQHVYFWHLIGGTPYGYSQEGAPNVLGAVMDIKDFGLNQRQEQFFVRVSSNLPLEELRESPVFQDIVASLAQIGLEVGAEAPSFSTPPAS